MKKDLLKVLIICFIAIIPTVYILNKDNISYSKGTATEEKEFNFKVIPLNDTFTYTKEEIYSSIEQGIINEDLQDIYLNFYNYFTKDTIFKNKYQEEYTYESYTIIKEKVNNDELFINYITNYNKCNLYQELFNTNEYCR